MILVHIWLCVLLQFWKTGKENSKNGARHFPFFSIMELCDQHMQKSWTHCPKLDCHLLLMFFLFAIRCLKDTGLLCIYQVGNSFVVLFYLNNTSHFMYSSAQQKDDRKILKRWRWSCVLMDEAHALKDKNSYRWKNLMGVARNANQRLMLTGTPLQNDLHV